MQGKLLPIVLGLAILAWIGAVAVSAIANWPHMPLDMSGRDPIVAAVHQKAVTSHLLRSVLIALVPAITAGLVLLSLQRRRK